MKLKDIKEHFDVIEYNGYYLLFDKEINTSQYLNKKYYGKIKYDSKKEIVTLVEDVAEITPEEYLEDYGSEKTKKAGYELIEKELEKLPDSIQKEKIIANLEAVKHGTRDLRF